jgi:hypothetical protein
MKIGIDFGGVLIRNYDRESSKSIKPLYSFLELPPVDQALESVTQLTEYFGSKNVYIVSKISEEDVPGLFEWLTEHYFFSKAGLLTENVYCCRK